MGKGLETIKKLREDYDYLLERYNNILEQCDGYMEDRKMLEFLGWFYVKLMDATNWESVKELETEYRLQTGGLEMPKIFKTRPAFGRADNGKLPKEEDTNICIDP